VPYSIILRSKYSWYDGEVRDSRQSKYAAHTDVPNIPPVRRDENSQPIDVRLLLDYDGTLVPLAQSPGLAVPDSELLALLDALAGRRELRVGIVSGRAHSDLDSWLGHLPIALWAEHGFWHRSRPGEPWEPACSVPHDWTQSIAPILRQITASTPGSIVERKTVSIAWHYRLVEPTLAARQMRILRIRLDDELRDQPFDVIEGKKVIEVRLRCVSKALAAERIAADVSPETAIVAIGDDQTDEELFCALPESSVTVAVGNQPSKAKYRLADYRAVRRMLRSILADPGLLTTPDYGPVFGGFSLPTIPSA
jgi:trehalose 6-phosphate synthase/phosphatase